MIISEDHILEAELNNLTRILLARAYPLHLIIKNIKKALTHNCNYLLSQRTPHTETNILHIITPFSDMGKQLTRSYTEIGTLLPTIPHSPPSGYPDLCRPTLNPTVFIATLFITTLDKHMVPHSKIPRTTTHSHSHTPIRT